MTFLGVFPCPGESALAMWNLMSSSKHLPALLRRGYLACRNTLTKCRWPLDWCRPDSLVANYSSAPIYLQGYEYRVTLFPTFGASHQQAHASRPWRLQRTAVPAVSHYHPISGDRDFAISGTCMFCRYVVQEHFRSWYRTIPMGLLLTPAYESMLC